jgi:hypothetical protein
MSALGTLRERVLDSEIVRRECRNCGTTLDADDGRCPECAVRTWQPADSPGDRDRSRARPRRRPRWCAGDRTPEPVSGPDIPVIALPESAAD